jgi:integrase
MKPNLVSNQQIENYKHRLLGMRAPSTVRGTLLFLRMGLEMAVERGLIIVNPCKGVKLPGVKRTLDISEKHQLSPEGFDKIIDHMRKGRGPSRRASELAELLAYTGQRISEANLTWSRVSWARREMTSHTRKGRVATDNQERKRVLPFFPRLEELLTRLKGRYGCEPNERICKVKECRITLEHACDALKLPRLTQQDLRHLFTTWAVEAGVDIPTIADWLGPEDGGALLMRTYRHHRREHSQAQAAKLAKPANTSPAA